MTLLAGCGSKVNENEIPIGINYELSAWLHGQASVEGINLLSEVNKVGN